jgi:hypothetical protein
VRRVDRSSRGVLPCVSHCVIKCSCNKHPALTVRKVEEVRIKKLICRISWRRYRPYCDHPQVNEHIKTVQSNLSFGFRTYAYELPLILTVLFFGFGVFARCARWIYWRRFETATCPIFGRGSERKVVFICWFCDKYFCSLDRCDRLKNTNFSLLLV